MFDAILRTTLIISSVVLTVVSQATPLLVLLAQAAPGVIDPGWVQLFATGGTGAILVWYVWYDVSTRTPALLATFTKEQSELRDTFTREQAEMHRHYSGIVDQLRQSFTAEQAATRNSFAAEQTAVRARHEHEFEQLRKMLYETMQSMRGAVHDVKNTAQTVMNTQAVKNSTG